MKNLLYHTFLLLTVAFFLAACRKDNYPGGTISPYIPLYDLRTLYKGSDLTLTGEKMFGSTKITGIVVSDYKEGNMPEGLLVIQDRRRLNQLRGIAIPIGAEAANYATGDSVVVDVEGGILKKADGILQITNISAGAVTKVSSGNNIPVNRVPSSYILADPGKYESTLVAIVKGSFDPLPAEGDVLEGEKVLNDGFENIKIYTDAHATFAGNHLPVLANYYGIIFNHEESDGSLVPQLRIRKSSDIQVLSSTIEITPIIITGYMADPKGGDGNYEYMQFMATRDIDFSQTPYSVVVTNNAGASNPTGVPSEGWATGSKATSGNARTFKFNLTSGTVAKGTFFYVGGSAKMINGEGSTSITANWVRSFDYTSTNGDGFGLKTTNLLANSGNASGFAVFEGTAVTKESKPLDVVFIGSGGTLLSTGTPAVGYKITNTDFYDEIDPISLQPQPFYRQGSNTINFIYTSADVGYFNKLGGVYNPALGRWAIARTQTSVALTKSSPLTDIEGEGATTLK